MNESPHQSDSLSHIYKDKTVKEKTTLFTDILKEHNQDCSAAAHMSIASSKIM